MSATDPEVEPQGRSARARFLDALGSVVGFALDSPGVGQLVVDAEPVGTLNEPVFWEHLHVPRPDLEAQLADCLLANNGMFLVLGQRGAGKTTNLRSVVRSVGVVGRAKRVIYLNCKTDLPADFNDPQSDAGAASGRLRRSLMELVRDALFPSDSDKRHMRAWILAGADPSRPRTGVFNDFIGIGESARTLAKATDDAPHFTRVDRISRQLSNDLSFAAEYIDRLDQQMTMSHTIAAWEQMTPSAKGLVVAFDNVDMLDPWVQSQLVQLILESHSRLAGRFSCVFVVCARPESVRNLARPGSGSDVIKAVPVESGTGLPLGPFTSTAKLQGTTDSHLQLILNKRYQLLVEFLRNSKTGRDLANDIAGQLLHEFSFGQAIENSVHRLTNGSVRYAGLMHMSFARRISELIDLRLLDARFETGARFLSSLEEGFLRTLYFLWLAEDGERHELSVFGCIRDNSVDFRKLPDSVAFRDLGSLQYIMLAYLSVSSESLPEGSGVRVAGLLEALALLGFDERSIRAALLALAFGPVAANEDRAFTHMAPRFVEITTPAGGRLSPNWHEESTCALTVSGREYVRSISVKVGYIWGAAFRAANGRSSPLESYCRQLRTNRVKLYADLARYLSNSCALSLLALDALRRQVGRPESWGEHWAIRYRETYCADQKLYSERVLESIKSFYGGERESRDGRELLTRVTDLERRFLELVRSVENGVPLLRSSLIQFAPGDHEH
ncbi:MAG: hypothetical protein IT460_13385 [Planctomycetes bacterium]|nr:hypothetical protein [Planctomycetota bacterium]